MVFHGISALILPDFQPSIRKSQYSYDVHLLLSATANRSSSGRVEKIAHQAPETPHYFMDSS